MEKYRQVMPNPNPINLSRLLMVCKGDRNMKEFSEITGIYQSTLSRILNCRISKPLKVEVMEKIYDARPSDIDITFDQFIIANGMIDIEKEPLIIITNYR